MKGWTEWEQGEGKKKTTKKGRETGRGWGWGGRTVKEEWKRNKNEREQRKY